MAKTPATSSTGRFVFYDVEALANAFTLSMLDRRTAAVDVYWLVPADGSRLDQEVNRGAMDQRALAATIRQANPALPAGATLRVWDLSTWEANERLARAVGVSDARMVCNPRATSSFPAEWRPVCDTDDAFDPTGAHPYLAGYNSYNYDTTMLAVYFTLATAHLGGKGASMDRAARAAGFAPVSTAELRRHNDQLFSESFIDFMPGYLNNGEIAEGRGWDSTAHLLRQAMVHSGRHIDVAMFNEVQRRVALKRGLGGLGRQILESGKLGHDSVLEGAQDLFDLIAYNVSDVVGLSHLFEDPIYSSAFDLKNGLLHEYPETRYEQSKFGYRANVSDRSVRRDRLGPDSTSAKFVARILAPYSNLVDLPAVSFMYPSQEVAERTGIARRDVLEQCRDFFYGTFDDLSDPRHVAARAAFDQVYAYYADIRGKNFNTSEEYRQHHPDGSVAEQLVHGNGAGWSEAGGATTRGKGPLEASYLADIAKRPLNIPYFQADGSESSCFATFSTGGIHGAEADWAGWRAERAEWDAQAAMIEAARAAYPDPRDLVLATRAEHERIELPDGSTVDKPLVLIGSDPAKVSWRKPKKGDAAQNEQLARAQGQVRTAAALLDRQRPAEDKMLHTLPDGTVIDTKKVLSNATATSAAYREAPSGRRPELFEATADGGNKLRPKYAHTSMGPVVHEDFSSYYPNLLSNMGAFYNPDLGEDRYAKILADKDRYGAMMKDPSISSAERARLSVLRNGTKLILNSASGAGDTTFANQPIRVNNSIISMRLIGQMFAWLIGQAQTLAGASVVSTNTDGLYAMADDAEGMARLIEVLAEQQQMINIEIEPEPLVVVTKDSNNRLEMALKGPRDLRRLDDAERGRIEALLAEGTWNLDTTRIVSGSGGTLACLAGPRPDKSLAHPAIRDYALARYLRYVAFGHVPPWRTEPLSLHEPLDERLGRQILIEALREEDPVFAARLFQNVIAASNSKITIPFAADPLDPNDPDYSLDAITNPRPLQHYNRVFYVHHRKPGAVSLRSAGAWAIPPASRLKRREQGDPSTDDHDVAKAILRANGYARTRAEQAASPGLRLLPEDQDVQVRRISQIDPAWSCLIVNQDLHTMDPRTLEDLLGCLDLDVYVGMLAKVYEKNWMNSAASAAEDDEEDED